MFARTGIKTKIAAAYTVVFGILLAGFAVVTYVSVRNGALQKLDAQLAIFAGRVAEDVAQDLEDNETTDAGELPDFAPESLLGARAQVWNRKDSVVITDPDLSGLPLRPPADFEDDEASTESYSGGQVRLRILWQPVETDGTFPYVVQVAASLSGVDSELARLRWLFLILIPLSLLLSSMAAIALTRASLRPIDHMSETARAITAERLNERVEVPPAQDEVQRLAETLNGLLSRIETAFETQRQFVADASHELRTPLTVIRSELEFAARKLDQAQTQESIAAALAETVRLERLTQQLLALVRLDSGHQILMPATVRVDELLMDCVQHVKPMAELKQVEFRLQFEGTFEIPADPIQLKSAFLNVIENAVKYCPRQSVVEIKLVQRSKDENSIAVVIKDSGPGIGPDEQELIFGRFYRAKAHRGESNGSGLGLAIAKNIVELHKGTISLISKPGEGSEFTIMLPLEASRD